MKFLIFLISICLTSQQSADNDFDLKDLPKLIESLKPLSKKIESLKNFGIKGNNRDGRKYENGKIAKSCIDYIKPIDNGYSYNGDIGSGFYWILPNPSLEPFKVYCDMETNGGGWTFYYTTNNTVHLTSFSKSNPVSFSKNGYYADLRDLEFTDILYVRIDDMTKDWFTQTTKIKVNDYINGNILSMSSGIIYNKFLPNGGALKGNFYQLTIADNVNGYSEGLMISGYNNCIKQANNWCGDFTSLYYRTDSTITPFRGVCFRENGAKGCDNIKVSVAIR